MWEYERSLSFGVKSTAVLPTVVTLDKSLILSYSGPFLNCKIFSSVKWVSGICSISWDCWRSNKDGNPSPVPGTQGVPLRGQFHWVGRQKIASGIALFLSLILLPNKNSCPGLKEELSWDPESERSMSWWQPLPVKASWHKEKGSVPGVRKPGLQIRSLLWTFHQGKLHYSLSLIFPSSNEDNACPPYRTGFCIT